MGCGLIALGLWFLLGLKIEFNGIQLIPPYIAYVIFIWGTITVLKRYKNKYLSYSLILSFICLSLELLPEFRMLNILSCVVSFLQLACLLYGIKEIAQKNCNITKLTKRIKQYLIIFGILNLMIIISNIFFVEVIGDVLLVVILFFYTIIICKYLYQINNDLYLLDEPVKVSKPLSRTKSYKIIASITIVVSFVILMFSQNILVALIDEYSYKGYYMVFKGESENVRIDDLEIYGYTQNYGETMNIYQSHIYVRGKLLENSDTVVEKIFIKESEDFFYKSYGTLQYQTISKQEFTKCDIEEETTNVSQYNEKIIRDIQEGKVTLCMLVKFLDEDDNEIDTQTITLESVPVKQYEYQDHDLTVKNIFISEHTIMLESAYIRVKPSYYPSFNQNMRIEVELIDGNQSLLSFEVKQDSTEQAGVIYRGKIKTQPQLRINIYENQKLLDTKDYDLEEIQ